MTATSNPSQSQSSALMSSTPSFGPAIYDPHTWHHSQQYRQRFDISDPSSQLSNSQSDRAVTFDDEEIVLPSPAGLPWPRPQVLKPAREDLRQIHDSSTAPNSPAGSLTSSPKVLVGQLPTPAMLAHPQTQEHDDTEVPLPLRRTRPRRKVPINDTTGLKWHPKTHAWFSKLMDTCTDDTQRKILVNGLDPLMYAYDDELKSLSPLPGEPATIPEQPVISHPSLLVEESEGGSSRSVTSSSQLGSHENFTSALSSALAAVASPSSSSKGKRKMEVEDDLHISDEENASLCPLAKKVRMSDDVEAGRYRKVSSHVSKDIKQENPLQPPRQGPNSVRCIHLRPC